MSQVTHMAMKSQGENLDFNSCRLHQAEKLSVTLIREFHKLTHCSVSQDFCRSRENVIQCDDYLSSVFLL